MNLFSIVKFDFEIYALDYRNKAVYLMLVIVALTYHERLLTAPQWGSSICEVFPLSGKLISGNDMEYSTSANDVFETNRILHWPSLCLVYFVLP